MSAVTVLRRRPVMRYLCGVMMALLLAVPIIICMGNSNPLCYLVEKYSIEWYVMFCNYTETPPGSEG